MKLATSEKYKLPTVHVSATHTAFTMTGGLTGEVARWNPDPEEPA